MKNYFKIASKSNSGKRVYSLTGDSADLGTEEQVKSVNIGDWVAFREVERNTKTNDAGEIVECEPYTRKIVSYLGSKQGLVEALSETSLIDVEVDLAIQKETAKIKKEYKLEDIAVD